MYDILQWHHSFTPFLDRGVCIFEKRFNRGDLEFFNFNGREGGGVAWPKITLPNFKWGLHCFSFFLEERSWRVIFFYLTFCKNTFLLNKTINVNKSQYYILSKFVLFLIKKISWCRVKKSHTFQNEMLKNSEKK